MTLCDGCHAAHHPKQRPNTEGLASRLKSGKLALRKVLSDCRRSRGSRILLIADQFEEVFTLVEDEAVRNRFIDVLLAGIADPEAGPRPEVSLILTMRADFYGRALLHRPLADALQSHVENLGPMKRDELRAAIVKPAEKPKVSFDPSLVETLLDDFERKPGSLPLLQFALAEMWGRQEKGRITRNAYDAIGGVRGALARRAETIYSELTGKDTRSASSTPERSNSTASATGRSSRLRRSRLPGRRPNRRPDYRRTRMRRLRPPFFVRPPDVPLRPRRRVPPGAQSLSGRRRGASFQHTPARRLLASGPVAAVR